MVDVAGDDRPAPRHFVADEFGRHIIGDVRAPILPVADIFGKARPAQIFALRHIFHFRGDDAAPGIMHLADIRARLGTQGATCAQRKLRDPAATIRPLEPIILRPHFAWRIFLHIAPPDDPVVAQHGQASANVDLRRRVGIGTGRVIDPHRRFAAARLQRDFAHRNLQRADMDLARSPDGASGDADFGAGGNICHNCLSFMGERERRRAV